MFIVSNSPIFGYEIYTVSLALILDMVNAKKCFAERITLPYDL